MNEKEEPNRVTVNLPAAIVQWADELMRIRGFGNNRSAYFADLVRRDKERQEEKERQDRTIYPSHKDDYLKVAEQMVPEKQVLPPSEKHKRPKNPPGTKN